MRRSGLLGKTAKVAEVSRSGVNPKTMTLEKEEIHLLFTRQSLINSGAAPDHLKSFIFNNPNRTGNIPLRLAWAHFQIHLPPQ